MSTKPLDVNSEIGLKLIKILKQYRNDKDYVRGVLVYTENEENAKKLIDFINVGKDVDDETIYVCAMKLAGKFRKRRL